LIIGLRKKTPSILNVFSQWDQIVFPNAKASCVDPDRKTGKSDGYKRAMAAIRAEGDNNDDKQAEGAGDQSGAEGGANSG
jgi:hypothetical protein